MPVRQQSWHRVTPRRSASAVISARSLTGISTLRSPISIEIGERSVEIPVKERADMTADAERLGVTRCQLCCLTGMLPCYFRCPRHVSRPALTDIKDLPKACPRRNHGVVRLHCQRLIYQSPRFLV